MAERLIFRYDSEGDILHIDQVEPYVEQESEELDDNVVARLNPDTGKIENLEIMFFSSRLLSANFLEIPVQADINLAPTWVSSGT